MLIDIDWYWMVLIDFGIIAVYEYVNGWMYCRRMLFVLQKSVYNVLYYFTKANFAIVRGQNFRLFEMISNLGDWWAHGMRAHGMRAQVVSGFNCTWIVAMQSNGNGTVAKMSICHSGARVRVPLRISGRGQCYERCWSGTFATMFFYFSFLLSSSSPFLLFFLFLFASYTRQQHQDESVVRICVDVM